MCYLSRSNISIKIFGFYLCHFHFKVAFDIHNDNGDAADGVMRALIAIVGFRKRGHNSSLHFVANRNCVFGSFSVLIMCEAPEYAMPSFCIGTSQHLLSIPDKQIDGFWEGNGGGRYWMGGWEVCRGVSRL